MPIRLPRRLFLPVLMAALVFALYAVSSWSNRFVYDDHEVIENQFPIHRAGDLARIFREPHYLNFPYYRPITRATFALQKSFVDLDPRPYHVFNAVLAGCVLLAAYGLLRRPVFRIAPAGALLAATWFAVHPAISECVYPAASGRETLLPALFIILATWAYLGRGAISFCGAMLLFVIALLCKEQAAVLPAIFVLADLAGLTDFPAKSAARIGRYLSIAVIFAFYFVVRHLIFHRQTLHLALFQHPLEPFQSFLYGIQTAITPFMSLRYEPPFQTWFSARLAVISCAVVLALVIAALARGKSTRAGAIFWVGWFILLQLPTAHIVEQEAGYSERYAALAILAVPAIAAMLLCDRIKSRPRAAGFAAFSIWIALLACITYFRGSYYSDDASFCIQWQNTSPDAAGPHDGLGLLAQQRGQFPTAIQQYQAALDIQPDDATARNNLANLLATTGDFAGATQQYQWLMNNPASGADPVATMTNYAQLLGEEAFNRRDAALRDHAHQLLLEAIAIRPDYAQSHYILGLWNEAFGSREAAIRQFKFALSLQPGWNEVQQKLDGLTGRTATTRP
jgi:tetratricopeptide (TPR) repeat protein